MRARRLSRRAVYRDPWFTLYVDRVRMPAGHTIDKFHFFDFRYEAVGVLVEDVRGRLLLERVYRYTTDTTGWEIPAGGIEAGETPVQAARREVMEETGYELRGARLLYSYHPTNGTSNKVFHVVRGRAGLRRGGINPQEVERIRWFTRRDLRRRLSRREIRDGLSLVGLFFAGL